MRLSAVILSGALLVAAPAFAADVTPTCAPEQQVVDQQAAICDPAPISCPDNADCSPVAWSTIEQLDACENLKHALTAYKGCIKQRIDGFKDANATN